MEVISSPNAPFDIVSGDLVLKEGSTLREAEEYIWECLDEAATEQDWDRYQKIQAMHEKLEDNYG